MKREQVCGWMSLKEKGKWLHIRLDNVSVFGLNEVSEIIFSKEGCYPSKGREATEKPRLICVRGKIQ